ncbi:hypothetical protein C3L33_08699, partial [Rhododendron williamsianum]
MRGGSDYWPFLPPTFRGALTERRITFFINGGSSSIRTYIPTPPFLSPHTPQSSLSSSLKLTSPQFSPTSKPLLLSSPLSPPLPLSAATTSSFSTPSPNTPTTTFHGLCYVVGDNIDTDQIIPAEYLTLVPSNPDEYKKLGSYALIGLPAAEYPPIHRPRRDHLQVLHPHRRRQLRLRLLPRARARGTGGGWCGAVVAESYARIFFRNSVATGEVYPLESEVRVCEACRTGMW